MNKVVFKDDSQVVEILARKRYGTNNGVKVKVLELAPMAEDVEPVDLEQGLLFELGRQHSTEGIVNG